ncbi:DUF58 domain-containing protein [Radiobacillus sp. PE A8.2]|uniref:DUF58 domain-containing protein n=1 Tax=Radiobacillus sp. PE A8.2 TaxID=3380349 RepID=UPI003890C923
MHTLLAPALTKRLANYKILSKQIVRGGHKGERRSQRLGSSLEFSDYRLYNPGDDLRQIDWNTYARTQKYYIKRFLDEQELAVSVYLDCSKSMGVNGDKWHRAQQLAATFAFLSLANADRLSFMPVASDSRAYPYTKGKAMTNKVLNFIEQSKLATSDVRLGEKLLPIAHQGRQGALSILISDFLDEPEALFAAVKKMQAKRQQVLLLQVLLPEEQNPNYVGDLQLIDIETGGLREVSMSRKVLANYKQLYKDHINQIHTFCKERGVDFITCSTSTSLEETVFSLLRQKGWIGR